jgi:hypothetical protein
MVISSKYLPSLANNRKFILHIKAKGKFQAKDPLIQLYHCKVTGGVIEWMSHQIIYYSNKQSLLLSYLFVNKQLNLWWLHSYDEMAKPESFTGA